jgi:hypothetical protein
MALQRYWYVDNGQGGRTRLAIVEKSNSSVTKETITSNYTSVSEVKDIRIYAIDSPDDYTIDNLTSEKKEIPLRYHEGLVYKVIANGYKDPRNQKMDVAQYFDKEYEIILKKAKKQARSNMQINGFVKQVSY